MRQKTLSTVAFLILISVNLHADTFGTVQEQFDIEFVTIGSPGNEPWRGGTGAVAYEYRIGKFEISRRQIELANQLGELEISMSGFGDLALRPEMPASGISTNEAARFVNWLNESEGLPPAYKFDKQPGEEGYDSNAFFGVWEQGELGHNSENILRNALAKYVLPTDHEWVKAAYYDSGYEFDGGYRRTLRPLDEDEFVTFRPYAEGPADVSKAGTSEVNGLVGIIGNVWEINETPANLINAQPSTESSSQRLRGGAWAVTVANESVTTYGIDKFEFAFYHSGLAEQGFRVASVPEPNSQAPLLLAAVLFLAARRRR